MEQAMLKDIIDRYEAAHFLVNRRLNAMFRELMPEDLTVDQLSTLRYLQLHNRSTSSELADIFCVGKSSITAIVTRLFDKNLIQRLPDEKDRRVIYLALTEEGRQICDHMNDKIDVLLAKYIEPFSEQEAIGFIETFEKLAKGMMQS
ncbi:MarR family winged helix-turn-helix transcriptional regulator [Paenibacillus sinopodophylli]|uniref:MarR family winged helix-turn-helix transcriptional regulator n=1 Tax=Paenibacillus sinopodophylli TaxID=1837342 RepID=UPI00110CD23E|nr:MarR family transcriptional regulator [Paenibacillus sinopodophylli]